MTNISGLTYKQTIQISMCVSVYHLDNQFVLLYIILRGFNVAFVDFCGI